MMNVFYIDKNMNNGNNEFDYLLRIFIPAQVRIIHLDEYVAIHSHTPCYRWDTAPFRDHPL
jgi:hypothetical protein